MILLLFISIAFLLAVASCILMILDNNDTPTHHRQRLEEWDKKLEQ